jgi:hypothetical protein
MTAASSLLVSAAARRPIPPRPGQSLSGTTISTPLNAGIYLSAAYQLPLVVTDTGSVFVDGYYAAAIYSAIDQPATITNAGIISGGGYGISLRDGGQITNGSTYALTASINGGYDGVLTGARAPVTITNFATIASTNLASGNGVNAGGDATIINGTPDDTTARISGYFDGVFVGGEARITNHGTISASAISTQLGQSGVGVYLRSGGTITNGGTRDTAATITAPMFAVQVTHAPGTVGNFGTILGTGPLARGVLLQDGGKVMNGTYTDTTATIFAQGKNGVYAGGTIASTVTNMGTITGGKNGVALQNGGTVINGARTSTGAQISGARQGIYIEGRLPSFVANSGTIQSTGGFWGVSIYLRGSVANGGPTNRAALITGGGGVYNGGLANVLNYGKIIGTSRPAVDFKVGGAVTNYGSIGSATGTAIYFGNGDSRVAIAPGAQFGGAVKAGTGNNVVELMPGPVPGNISGFGGAAPGFTGFNTVKVDWGGSWILNGNNTINTLATGGTLIVTGSVDVATELDPAARGLLSLGAGATIEVASVLGAGPAISFLRNNTLVVDDGSKFGVFLGVPTPVGPLLQNFGTDSAIDLRDLPLAGVIVLDFFPGSGQLRVGHGSGDPVATLLFQTSSLGPGSFHIGADGVGGTLLTHK